VHKCQRVIPFVILVLFLIQAHIAMASELGIPITVDPRVELMSLIFRFAGNEEYNQGKIPSYLADADTFFEDFRNHGAIKFAERLRKDYGISYDAVASLALHISDPPGLEERTPLDPLPGSLDQRWTVSEVRGFLREVREFAEESRFMDFFTDHHDLYTITQNRMRQVLENQEIVPWFDAYFGIKPKFGFFIELGMFNGGASYGPHFSSQDNSDELHSILGVWKTDAEGLPVFANDVNNTVVHEFAHSFINPLVDARVGTLESSGIAMYSHVSDKMESLAYGNWKIMLYESLVRAVSIRWMDSLPENQIVPHYIKFQQRCGFYWMAGLNELLIEFENTRDKYSTFEQFFPVIEEYFLSYAVAIEANIASVETAWVAELEVKKLKAPHVINMLPANDSCDVDPNLIQIVFTFDRIMMDKNWAVMDTGKLVPTITDGLGYNDDRTKFIMPVLLEPSTSYEFSLNSPNGGAFKDEEGNQLIEYIVRFRTSGK